MPRSPFTAALCATLVLAVGTTAPAARATAPDPRADRLAPAQLAAYGQVLDGLLGVRAAAERGEDVAAPIAALNGVCAQLSPIDPLTAALAVDCLAIAGVLATQQELACDARSCSGEVRGVRDALRLSLAAGRAYNRALGTALRPGACRLALRHDRAALSFQQRLFALTQAIAEADDAGAVARARGGRARLAAAMRGRVAARPASQVRTDLALACAG